jgi:26S proteasome regulatory subunit N5
MRWPGIEELYGPKIRTSPVFAPDSDLGKKTGTNAEGKKAEELEKPGEWRWEQLHKRVVEHVSLCLLTVFRLQLTPQNIRVLASYYSRIHMSRLSELLDLPPLTTERTICKLVTDKTIFARIDRPAGIVTFKKKRDANDVLNVWSTDIGKMLGLVEKASHLVSKEYAMHEASKGGKGVKA